MKKTAYVQYLLLACLMQSSFTYSMMKTYELTDALEVTNNLGTTTTIYPTPQTWSSFTRQLLRNDLEKEINEQITNKVTIKASGENVALALDYATKNPTKVEKLVLTNPRINISGGTNPIDYYRGNFPLSALKKSNLQCLPISIENDATLNNEDDVKALIQLCRQGNAKTAIPNYLSEWYNQTSRNISLSKQKTQDPNAELNAIVFKERISWLSNKVLFITIAGLFYLISKKL